MGPKSRAIRIVIAQVSGRVSATEKTRLGLHADLMRGRGPHHDWNPEAMASPSVVDGHAGERLVENKSCRMFGDFPEFGRGSIGKRHCRRLAQWLRSNLDVRCC